MKASCLVALVILASISTTLATKGIDLSASFNNFSCVKSAGYSFAIVRGYKSFGEVDSVGHQNLKNAKAAGLIGDAYFFPCKGSMFQQNCHNHNTLIYHQQKRLLLLKQLSSIMQSVFTQYATIFGSEYGTVWIDVESNPSTGCGWSSSDHTGNCQFLQDLVNAFTAKKRLVGIYASQYQWSTIMGSASACAKFTSHPLWYAHYDNSPSFSDYSKYALGGWTTPSIKQYVGDTTLCSVGVDLNFY